MKRGNYKNLWLTNMGSVLPTTVEGGNRAAAPLSSDNPLFYCERKTSWFKSCKVPKC